MGTGLNSFGELFGELCFSSSSLSVIVKSGCDLPDIKDVIFNDPATIVFWADGTKTVVKCQKENGDTYSKETELAMAIVKKAYGNKVNFNDVFAKWLGE